MKNITISSPRQIVVPHRPKWHGEIAAWLIYALGYGLSRTWRIRMHDESGLFNGSDTGPLIFAIWHNRLAFSMTFWNRYGKHRRPVRGLAALISASKDGALLARTLEHFNVQAVRGSSSRRGPQALLELTSYIEEGYHVAITPDGPRGPKYQIQDGILSLAQVTEAPIVPVGAQAHQKYSLKSWDSFQLPLPFRAAICLCRSRFVCRAMLPPKNVLKLANNCAALCKASIPIELSKFDPVPG